ncbi:hypothetical protein K435DRAFT_869837 [Dendrothele bispora CBS 962.96]|uniref:Uncharacterized protein n=1 Tax=Dendrothele bispora (strain CBS 962.96) TaxID=1314807 RepID=A0A4S8L8V4_DENBC|nr:hypothetical protein K435DRAFT_869837 [Dendrothele bispora CBS 962.96]
MPLPTISFSNFLVKWSIPGTTTVLRFPTLASLPETETETPEAKPEATTPANSNGDDSILLSDQGEDIARIPDAVLGAHENNPGPSSRQQSIPFNAQPSATRAPIYENGPNHPGSSSGSQEAPFNSQSSTGATGSNDTKPSRLELNETGHSLQVSAGSSAISSAESSSLVRTEDLTRARRPKRSGGRRIRRNIYSLPTPNKSPELKTRKASRLGGVMRWYISCNDDVFSAPPAVSAPPQLHDIFLHVSLNAAWRDIKRDVTVLFQHLKFWVFTEAGCWESIEFGGRRLIGDKEYALTVNVNFEPSWVKWKTMSKDERYQKICTSTY